MERHRTLIAIGMRDQAGFTADAQHAAEKVDIAEASREGRLEDVQLVCDWCPDRVNQRGALVRPHRPDTMLLLLLLLLPSRCCPCEMLDANSALQCGDTALQCAAKRDGNLGVVEALLEGKADMNAQDEVPSWCWGVGD
eukprot:TRINITY_DN12909_c0_g1_i1.p2 TRINITY_DN12909_c0_g1~~TRINITY_DN12909_c0_g1_i1.p2  ORF type:complete len:139 (-),score=38.00 TRINITY_DN12909_c0_g1_i1:117-533(-)